MALGSSLLHQVHVAKNTLLRVAIEGNDKWTSVQPVLERENLWFFVDEDVKVRDPDRQ